MSASLVGSEMCIRDSSVAVARNQPGDTTRWRAKYTLPPEFATPPQSSRPRAWCQVRAFVRLTC
eukprot:5865309-Alexandrium_andersonii.AAC.1